MITCFQISFLRIVLLRMCEFMLIFLFEIILRESSKHLANVFVQINLVGRSTVEVFKRPELLSPQVLQSNVNDQLHKFVSSIQKPEFNLFPQKTSHPTACLSHPNTESSESQIDWWHCLYCVRGICWFLLAWKVEQKNELQPRWHGWWFWWLMIDDSNIESSLLGLFVLSK